MESESLEKAQDERPSHRILDEVAEMKERLSRMESFIQQAVSLAAAETRLADEIKESFEATVSALEAQLQPKEDTPDQASALRELDESLATRICDLESRLREKEETLEVREAELKDLRVKVEEAAVLVATETQRAQEIQENFAATLAALKAQLEEKDALLGQKDITLRGIEAGLTGLEENLMDQIRGLQSQLEGMLRKSGAETGGQNKKKGISRRPPKQS